MIDSIHIWISGCYYSNQPLDNGKIIYDQTTSEWNYSIGHHKNMRICISVNGVSIKGSLTTYYKGTNFFPLTYSEVLTALTQLGNELSIPILEGKITRIDLADTLEMNHKVQAYYPLLGQKSRMRRRNDRNTLYFENSNWSIIIYDKVKENKNRNINTPSLGNWLRFETSYLAGKIKPVIQSVNRNKLFVKDLFHENIYNLLVSQWYEDYQSIHKIVPSKLLLSNIYKCGDFVKALSFLGIKNIGGEKLALDIVEQLRNLNTGITGEELCRMKNKVKLICNHPQLLEQKSNLLDELNKKIEQAYKNHLLPVHEV